MRRFHLQWKSKLGALFLTLYLLSMVIVIKGFFNCNGFQFDAFHGKCTFGFISLPFGFLSMLVESSLYFQDPWDSPSVGQSYLFTFAPIILDALFWYSIGLLVEKGGKKLFKRK